MQTDRWTDSFSALHSMYINAINSVGGISAPAISADTETLY